MLREFQSMFNGHFVQVRILRYLTKLAGKITLQIPTAPYQAWPKAQ